MSKYLNPQTFMALICRRCGALVDQAFTVEHDRFHEPTTTERPAAEAVGESEERDG